MSTDSLLWDLLRATRCPGSGVAKFRVVPSFSPNLCPSFTSKENPFSPHALSSNIRTLLIVGFGFSYSFITASNLINLFSCSTDLSPRPPLSHRRSSTAVELRECLPPFSRSTSLSLYQCSAALPMATVGSTLGTSRQARRTGLLP